MKSTADWLKEVGYHMYWDDEEDVWHLMFALKEDTYSYCDSACISYIIVKKDFTIKKHFPDFDFYPKYVFSNVCTKCIKTTKADIPDLKHAMLVTKLTIK